MRKLVNFKKGPEKLGFKTPDRFRKSLVKRTFNSSVRTRSFGGHK